MKWALIVNPVAGNGFALKTLPPIEEKLQQEQAEYCVLRTEMPGHGTKLAKDLSEDPEIRGVAAVGGDGTACEVAAGLCNTNMPMAIIPAGTGNDFIKSVGIPKDPIQAVDFMLRHEPLPTDTGTVNDDFFLNVCGTGFDVSVLDFAEEEKKKHRGLTPYLLGLLKAISRYQSVRVRITHDGETEEEDYLVCSVANGRFIGGGIPICPVANPADGNLDLVMIADRKRWQIPFYLPGLMLSKDLTFRITRHLLAEEVSFEGENLRINIDGDIRTMQRAAFRINPGSLRMIRAALPAGI